MNNYVYFSNVGKFIGEEKQSILNQLSANLKALTGEEPDDGQKRAWDGMIEPLKGLFSYIKEDIRCINEDIYLVMEYKLPFSNKRIDLLLFGKDSNYKKTILVFELKGWSQVGNNEKSNKAEIDNEKSNQAEINNGKSNQVKVVQNVYHHPELQLLSYLRDIEYYHSCGNDFSVFGVIWAYNLNENSGLSNHLKQNIQIAISYNLNENSGLSVNEKDIKIFFKNQTQELACFINEHIKSPIEEEEVNRFLKGKYTQSQRLFKLIKDNFNNLERDIYNSLEAKGYKLSDEQKQLIEKILKEVIIKNNIYNSLAAKGYKLSNEQKQQLIEKILEEVIKNNTYNSLAAKGYAPSDEQLIKKILSKVKENQNQKYAFFISGGPGSGKTYLAILLLLTSLLSDLKSIIFYRNKILINTLRKAMQSLSLDNSIKFFTDLKELQEVENIDIAIYDEAQRMDLCTIEKAINFAKVNVFFYDEKQILNMEEKGKLYCFICVADELKIPYESIYLSGNYRVSGGNEYIEFVEKLLSGNLSKMPSFNNYEFRVFNNINDMLGALKEKSNNNIKDKLDSLKEKLKNNIKEMSDALKEESNNNIKEMLDSLKEKLNNNIKEMLDALEEESKNNKKEKSKNNKVALVAAFTESDGRGREDEDKLRVGDSLKSGFGKYKGLDIKIYWLMNPETEYPSYWLTNKSNELTHCASIYGCQGFEADYVGVIWGRDLVWRQNEWQLGDNCEDYVGKPISLKDLIQEAKKGNKEYEALAIELLKNRYRIFLTRGISGTYVYCEDDDTLNYLLTLTKQT